MAADPAEVELRLNRDDGHRERFREVFGEERIGVRRIARALAAYRRSLVPRSNPGTFVEG